MINTWKVLWVEDGAKKKRTFESDPPTPAVEFGRDLKRRGLSVEIISGRRAFAPPPKAKYPDRPGLLWCPYCIKWREYFEAALRDSTGLLGPSLLRCPTCTISIRDAFVRKYNIMFYKRWEVQEEMKKNQMKEKKAKKPSAVFRSRRRNN